jgi:hypothetical protein
LCSIYPSSFAGKNKPKFTPLCIYDDNIGEAVGHLALSCRDSLALGPGNGELGPFLCAHFMEITKNIQYCAETSKFFHEYPAWLSAMD